MRIKGLTLSTQQTHCTKGPGSRTSMENVEEKSRAQKEPDNCCNQPTSRQNPKNFQEALKSIFYIILHHIDHVVYSILQLSFGHSQAIYGCVRDKLWLSMGAVEATFSVLSCCCLSWTLYETGLGAERRRNIPSGCILLQNGRSSRKLYTICPKGRPQQRRKARDKIQRLHWFQTRRKVALAMASQLSFFATTKTAILAWRNGLKSWTCYTRLGFKLLAATKNGFTMESLYGMSHSLLDISIYVSVLSILTFQSLRHFFTFSNPLKEPNSKIRALDKY